MNAALTWAQRSLQELPWSIVILLCLTLGLAPFAPPHIWEKLKMLAAGELRRPVDIFDFLFHGVPWLLLVLKVVALSIRQAR